MLLENSLKKLPSLSIFFPFFNDEGTVAEAIEQAYKIGSQVTDDLEVIALHGGLSHDGTWQKILEMKKRQPRLKVVNREDNSIGYAVIKSGFEAATKEWIFYTDGDLQYRVEELPLLIQSAQENSSQVVNGYKLNRGDALHRLILGRVYQYLSKVLFQLPIRDVDCDFRLVKKSVLQSIELKATHAAILPELIFKLKMNGATFSEVPVTHQARKYGHSNYKWWQLTWEKITGDTKLFFTLHQLKQNPGKSHS